MDSDNVVCSPTLQAVYECYNSSPMAVTDPEPLTLTNHAPDSRQSELQDCYESGAWLVELWSIGTAYGHRRSLITIVNILDSQGMPHTVDTEPYQSSPNQKINCVKVTYSRVVRLIFRHDPLIGGQIDAPNPKIWDLSFHLSYR